MILRRSLGLKGDFQITNWLLDHKSGLHWQKMSKNHLENSHSALAEDSAAVAWVINHSVFIKRSSEKLLGSRGEFHITNWLPDHKSGLNWLKNVEHHLKMFT